MFQTEEERVSCGQAAARGESARGSHRKREGDETGEWLRVGR